MIRLTNKKVGEKMYRCLKNVIDHKPLHAGKHMILWNYNLHYECNWLSCRILK